MNRALCPASQPRCDGIPGVAASAFREACWDKTVPATGAFPPTSSAGTGLSQLGAYHPALGATLLRTLPHSLWASELDLHPLAPPAMVRLPQGSEDDTLTPYFRFPLLARVLSHAAQRHACVVPAHARSSTDWDVRATRGKQLKGSGAGCRSSSLPSSRPAAGRAWSPCPTALVGSWAARCGFPASSAGSLPAGGASVGLG